MLACLRFKKGDKTKKIGVIGYIKENDTECPICLTLLCNNNTIELPCTHKYHTHCIKKWAKMETREICPTCRQSFKEFKEKNKW